MSVRHARALASVDANTVIHFYRACFAAEPGYVLDGIIDPFVMGEIERRAKDVYEQLTADLSNSAFWLKLITRDKLSNVQKAVYDRSYNDNRLLFDPQDWGEAKAIALGHATGALVLLTDDAKKSGPRDYILKGAIEAIDTIAFWEVLIMLYARGDLTPEGLVVAFDRIKEKGYTTPPKVTCNTAIPISINRLRKAKWFADWLVDNSIGDGNLEGLIGKLA